MNVRVITGVPRDMGFRAHWHCQREALFPLGLMPVEASGCFWNEQLENLIELAIRDGFDYVLTIDFDTIFDRQHVEDMLALGERNPQADVIVPWFMRRDTDERNFGVRRDDGTFRRRFSEEEFEPELMPIHTGHFGFTLIRLAALEKMPRPLLWAQPDENGRWFEGCVQSDIYFFNQVKAHGLNLCLATQIRVGHLQQVISWPTKDFGIEHQYVEAFRKEGTPESTR